MNSNEKGLSLSKVINYFKEDKNRLFIFGIPIISMASVFLLLLEAKTILLVTFTTLSLMVLLLLYFSVDYIVFMRVSEAEENYPDFLEDLSESKSAGMTMSQAVSSCAGGEYGALEPYIKKLEAMLSWGIPFNKAWKKFTKRLKQSELITRLNVIILEAFNSGANISSILQSLASRAGTIRNVENERKSVMRQQAVMMYILYFGFLGIIVLLQRILLPTLYIQSLGSQGLSQIMGGGASGATLTADYFKQLFMFVILIQAGCSGVLVGQILEEKVIGGMKHIAIMFIVGIVVFFVFVYPMQMNINSFISEKEVSGGAAVNIGGTINADGTPAGGAKVVIKIPQRENIHLKTESDGKYYKEFEAPPDPGQYTIVTEVTYEGKTKSVKNTLVVT